MPKLEKLGEYTPEGKPYLGTILRKFRYQHTDRWPTAASFANELGIHRAYLSNIELSHSNPGIGLLIRIAERTGIPVDDLMQAPLHPRLVNDETIRHSRRFIPSLSIGARISEIVVDSNLLPDERILAEQLIEDTARAIVLRIRSSRVS